MKKKTNSKKLATMLGISRARSTEAVIKAKLIKGIQDKIRVNNITHLELAELSGLPRSAVSGILSGSLQKVTIDRLLRMVDGLGMEVEVRLKKVA